MDFISVRLYQKLFAHVLQEGLAPSTLAHLPTPDTLKESTQVVPADKFFELHEIADQHLEPGCSVRVGQDMKLEDYGILGLSWKTCARAGEIFERCERYFRLLSNTYVFKVEHEAEVSNIYLFRDTYRRGVELSNEATFSASVVVLQAMTESDITPVSVSFKHAPPPNLTSHHESFKCPVLFGQSSYHLTYKKTDLDKPTAKSDRSIHQFLQERVEEEATGIEVNANKLVFDVKNLIKDSLPSGIPSIHEIGKHIGMSNRTLTRRLSDKGYTFRDLIKYTQQEISTDLLRNSSQSVSEIAFQTGFSEQSAFNRAFKRWTGKTPLAYRKN